LLLLLLLEQHMLHVMALEACRRQPTHQLPRRGCTPKPCQPLRHTAAAVPHPVHELRSLLLLQHVSHTSHATQPCRTPGCCCRLLLLLPAAAASGGQHVWW
jgi:hypothetical protein